METGGNRTLIARGASTACSRYKSRPHSKGTLDSNQQASTVQSGVFYQLNYSPMKQSVERAGGIEPRFSGLEDQGPRPSDGGAQDEERVARVLGIEPRPSGSKPAVLPLDGHPLEKER